MAHQEQNNQGVPAGTKFEIRGFMGGDPATAPTTKEVSAEEADALMSAAPVMSEEDAEIVQSLGDPQAEEEVPAAAAKGEPKIRIGNREFATSDEAWLYAQELEQEKIAADAFRQGVEIAQRASPGNPAPEVPQVDPDEKFDEEFYANPKEYLKKRDERIAEKVQGEVTRKAEMARRTEDTWSKFKSTYPDLSGADEFADVQSFIREPGNWSQLQHMDTDKALKIAADAIRGKYARILKSRMPGEELAQVKTAASPGGGVRVTREVQPEKMLNFVQQHNTLMKKKRTGR